MSRAVPDSFLTSPPSSSYSSPITTHSIVMAANPIEALVSSFVDSPLRRLLFPYLEGSDHEDPSKKAHWMSHAYDQGLGRERAGAPHPHATSIKRDARHQMSPSSSSSTSLAEVMDGPWALMYFGQHSDDDEDHDDDGHSEDHRSEDERERKRSTRTSSRRRPHRAAGHTGQPQSQTHSTARPSAAPRMYTSSGTLAGVMPEREALKSHRRHHRHLSAPQPMSPAQPLPHVNTMLPLRIPPPELQAKSPLEYPGNYFGELPERSAPRRRSQRRGSRPSNGTVSDPEEINESSGSSSSDAAWRAGNSSESDGSYHGDVGDEDPEAQLAAGIAALKAQQRANATAAAASSQSDADETFDREIAQHSGRVITSLADIFFGRARSRATSQPQSPKEVNYSAATHIPRSQSVDALQEPAWRRNRDAAAAAMLRQTSTPASIRAEVQAWSQGRQESATATTRTQRLLSSLPFAYSLFGPSSLRLAETLDLEEEEGNVTEETTVDSAYTIRAATLSNNDISLEYDSADDDAEEASTTAYSSLWASPTVSRSSSHYNLDLLATDEPSAFEDAAGEEQQQQRLRSLQRLRMLALSSPEKEVAPGRRKKTPITTAVSPLWDQSHADEDSHDDAYQLSQGAGQRGYERPWSSVVGLRGTA
ncbi:hypothetical protein BDZ90DRAFT_180749 [Jaminaea rosea]|uniref:Uncharacterized protein n=1 Tax=Jaminaea rosea TaxID=1569628 RepID=A0A316UQC8_9BASI|nr:hypothetical protein BDZ90DRAFT_180749 [Jaminaea rosea]PWN27509.1 hypothetical protein BDZ90DRAFT_180749 [Jaminaea rosea]